MQFSQYVFSIIKCCIVLFLLSLGCEQQAVDPTTDPNDPDQSDSDPIAVDVGSQVKIQLLSVELVDDDLQDQLIDQHETGYFRVTFTNSGTGAAKNVTVEFKVSSAKVEITSGQEVTVPEINKGASLHPVAGTSPNTQEEYSFAIQAKGTAQSGDVFEVDITMTEEGGKSWTAKTEVVIGSPYDALVHYTFDHEDGMDLMGNVDGEIVGATFSDDTPDETGKALKIEEGQYMKIPEGLLYQKKAFSISVWVKLNQGTVPQMLMNSRDFLLDIRQNLPPLPGQSNTWLYVGQWDYYCSGQPGYLKGFELDPDIIDARWHYLGISFEELSDGSFKLTSLVDGVDVSNTYWWSGFAPTKVPRFDPFEIFIGKAGCDNTSTSYPLFNGEMDNLRIYDYPLTIEKFEGIWKSEK
ncbi:MAG: LamG-like jellyroll fold domain-containing protein [Bacteroidota bacterium]